MVIAQSRPGSLAGLGDARTQLSTRGSLARRQREVGGRPSRSVAGSWGRPPRRTDAALRSTLLACAMIPFRRIPAVLQARPSAAAARRSAPIGAFLLPYKVPRVLLIDKLNKRLHDSTRRTDRRPSAGRRAQRRSSSPRGPRKPPAPVPASLGLAEALAFH